MRPKSFQPFPCAECGDTVQLSTGPGRFQLFRYGEPPRAVPDHFAIPTCATCGETYLTVELGRQLADLQIGFAQPPNEPEWWKIFSITFIVIVVIYFMS